MGLLSCTGNQLFEAVDPAKAATWEDFEWYLNKTLRPQGDLCALHEAVLQARKLSRRPQLQARLVLTIPFPSRQTFGGPESQKAAIDRYMDRMAELYRPFEQLDTLRLCGLYWLHEDASQTELIDYAGRKARERGLAFCGFPTTGLWGLTAGRQWDLMRPSCSQTTTLMERSRCRFKMQRNSPPKTTWGWNWSLTSALLTTKIFTGVIWII